VIGSFGPVTDPSILDVQPRRIDIVQLPRRLSLESFQQAYPSSIPIEMLAIINQVRSPSAVLESSTLVKRVVGENVATARR